VYYSYTVDSNNWQCFSGIVVLAIFGIFLHEGVMLEEADKGIFAMFGRARREEDIKDCEHAAELFFCLWCGSIVHLLWD
jgi:hypothetical protein